jgi:hypothetical protein
MSTPIFDELLREFASRMEEPQPEAAPQFPAPQLPAPAGQPNQTTQSSHRHRAE